MYQVGTNAGRAWQFREGEGEAAIIKTPLYDNYLGQMAILNEQERRTRKAKEAEDFQQRVDLMNKAYQDSKFEGSADIRAASLKFLDRAAEYRQRTGRNPFLATNTDEEAKGIQKNYQQFISMPQSANNVVNHLEAQRQLLQANPGMYEDDENAKAIAEGYGGGKLVEYAMGNKPLPTLRSKAPVADLVGGIKATLDNLQVKVGDLSKLQEIKGNIPGALFNGKDGAAFENSAKQMFNDMTDDQKTIISQKAAAAGMTEAEYIVADLAEKSIAGGWSPERALNEAFTFAQQYVEYKPGGGVDAKRAVDLSMSRLKEDPVSWQAAMTQFGTEDNIRKEMEKKPWGLSKGYAGRGGGSGGSGSTTSDLVTFEDWVGALEGGYGPAQGMLAGTDIDIYLGGPQKELVSGTVVQVEYKGVYDPATQTWLWQPPDPKEKTGMYTIRVAVKDALGGTKLVEREIDRATLERIAIVPVTNYLKSKQGAGQVASDFTPGFANDF